MKIDYHVGQEVIITGNTSGHAFKIGQKVCIIQADNRGPRGSYAAKGLGGLRWWFNSSECKPVNYESNKAAKDLLEVDY